MANFANIAALLQYCNRSGPTYDTFHTTVLPREKWKEMSRNLYCAIFRVRLNNNLQYMRVPYISAPLQRVAIEVLSQTGQFRRRWRLDAKQLPLKCHIQQHPMRNELQLVFNVKSCNLLCGALPAEVQISWETCGMSETWTRCSFRRCLNCCRLFVRHCVNLARPSARVCGFMFVLEHIQWVADLSVALACYFILDSCNPYLCGNETNFHLSENRSHVSS